VGEKGAQILALEAGQSGAVDGSAEMPGEEPDQTAGGGRIGADGVRGAAAVAGEMLLPAQGGFSGRVAAQGISHRPIERVRTRPRNISNSEP
jgi:hypothetical protein